MVTIIITPLQTVSVWSWHGEIVKIHVNIGYCYNASGLFSVSGWLSVDFRFIQDINMLNNYRGNKILLTPKRTEFFSSLLLFLPLQV